MLDQHRPARLSSSRRHVGLVAATAVLVAAGLGGGFAWGHHAGTSSTDTIDAVSHRASATAHDAADVRFAQMMVPHHQQALVMVAMVDDAGGSRGVRSLAASIGAAQSPEITAMQGWLSAWGATPDTGLMTGMMSSADMTQLGKLTGADFDREWITMMIQHHEGAVEMAQAELTDGENADALALAGSIVVTQEAQIEQMRDLVS